MTHIAAKTGFWAKAPRRIFKNALTLAVLCTTLVALIWASSTTTGPTPHISGFSLGGGTALVTAGARLSKDAFIAYCAESAGKDNCLWLIQGAAHFSFLARCSLFGVIMISVAGDDNICSDRGLRPRDEVQAELAAEIGAFFAQSLK